jgi:sugar porter (SP) family MFS transporter
MTGRRSVLGESIATAALAGLLFGFDTAVIAGVTGDLTRVFALSPQWLGVTVSAALWGTLIGALFAGKPGDRIGSRDALRILAFFYLLAGIGCALAWNWGAFIVFRFLCGLAIGGSSVLAPVYIAEIAPPARRGFLVGLFQFNVVAGILVAYLSNAIVGAFDLGDLAWRWKLGVTVLPALLFCVLLYRIPNSPRWLAAKGRIDEARDSLSRIGMDAPTVDGELATIRADLADAIPDERLSWRRHKRPILLAVALASFNQLAGINAILYYLNDIFAKAGSLSPDVQAVIIGVANLAFTMLGMLLIDRVGRRTLLVVGAIGMAVCLSAAAAVLFDVLPQVWMLPALVGFIAFFAPSQGAVIWVYLSEIFPTSVRSRGSGLGASTHWLLNAIVAGLFPAAAAWSAGAPFLFFAAMMAVQAVVVLIFFPETKGVPLEAIHARMQGQSA